MKPVLGPMEPCSWHKPSGLSYTAWHEDAERRRLEGQKQKRCPTCRRYFWPDEFGDKPKKETAASA